MIKKLSPYMKKYKKYLFLGVACAALEVVFELLIPLNPLISSPYFLLNYKKLFLVEM